MKYFSRIAAAPLALIAAGAISTAAVAQEYTVALVQSLTGPVAFIGAPFAEGFRMAFEEAMDSGAMGDLRLNLAVEDDANDRAQIITLVNRFAADPNVIFFAGPTSGSIAGVAARVANEVQIPMMSVSNVDEVRDSGPWSFITAQPQQIVVPEIGAFAVEGLGAQVCQTITITDNESYVLAERLFRENAAAAGARVLETIGIRGTDTDFSAVSVRIVNANADCVYVGAPAAMAANIIIQMRQAGLDPDTRIVGMSSFASPDLIRIGGAAVEGVHFVADWVPGGAFDDAVAFAERFEARAGRAPGNWEAMGYSLGQVVLSAIRDAGPNPTREAVRDALTATEGVPVVVGTGAFRLDETRTPLYGVNVLSVRDGQFVGVPRD